MKKYINKGMIKLISIFVLIFSGEAWAQNLEVMTYNIKYANENDGENSWSKRKDQLTDQIRFYEPDIFGVQEALLEQLEHLKGNLPNYNYIGVGREDGINKGEFSALFYDGNQFKVLEEGTFWLSETPGKISVGWDAALPRICTFALFENKTSKQNFWVFNTHFDHIGEKAREESANLILAKIEKLNTANIPVILMGDFNLEPETKAIQLLSKEMNDSKNVSKNVVFGPEGTFNGYNFLEPVTRRIDYIFISKGNLEVLKYAVLSDSWDLKYPSDHLPVFVELQF
jgi:endonuclease/exonuclease/phosphatase family metal-dependent hydrolase